MSAASIGASSAYGAASIFHGASVSGTRGTSRRSSSRCSTRRTPASRAYRASSPLCPSPRCPTRSAPRRGNAKYDGAAGESGAAPVPAFHGKKKKKNGNKKCECAGVRHATWGGSKCGDGDYHGRSWCYVAPGACADGTAHSSKCGDGDYHG